MQSEIDLLGTQSILDKKGISTKEDGMNYFTQGFEIPPQEQVIRDKLLNHFPILKTKTYRESILKIASSIAELDKFINNFEGKVDNLLQAQETQFVDSYKSHISKIKDQFQKMSKQAEQLQQKIRYYENEGKMSALVKKVFFLEQQSAKLYKAIAQKDKMIKDLQLTLKVQDYELKRMQNAIKLNARQKSQILWRQQQSKGEDSQPGIRVNDFTIFATQLGKKVSNSQSHHESFMQQKGCTTYKSLLANDLSLHSMTCQLQKNLSKNEGVTSKSKNNSFIQDQLYKENNRLKNRNKRLVSFQTKVVSHQNEIQQFFINCVEQLKKQIRIRKKINECSLQDFKKQDKLLLLIKVLSNNQILTYLHQRLFKKGGASKSSSQIPGASQSLGKYDQQADKKLPKISFNLQYQKK